VQYIWERREMYVTL